MNRRLFQTCFSPGAGLAQCQPVLLLRHKPDACLPSNKSSPNIPEGSAAAGEGSRGAGAEAGVEGSGQDSTSVAVPGTQPGTSHPGSSPGQAGGYDGVSLLVGHSNVRQDPMGSKPFTMPSQAMGSCSSSTTATVEGPPPRPDIKGLLTLVGRCLQSVVVDPAVMEAAHQPAPWMPHKASILPSAARLLDSY
jgi:hypothetical protein